MRHLDLFSGIGGFALAAEAVWPDVEHVFCDNDPFCQNVLRKHWPDTPIYADIRELTTDRLIADADGQRRERGSGGASEKGRNLRKPVTRSPDTEIDLLTGGFPCQPFSNAGKKRGDKDDRFLWPEMLRVIRETKPAAVIGENVAGIVRMALDQVCADLEGEGYAVQPFIVPACAVGAPHRRDRVWIVARADTRGKRRQQVAGSAHGDESADEGRATENDHKSCGHGKGVAPDTASPRPSQSRQAGKRKLQTKGGARVHHRLELPSGSIWSRDWREVALATCNDRVDDGLPKRLARLPDGTTISEARWRREALKAYGNAIVPQVAVEVMKAIKNATMNDGAL